MRRQRKRTKPNHCQVTLVVGTLFVAALTVTVVMRFHTVLLAEQQGTVSTPCARPPARLSSVYFLHMRKAGGSSVRHNVAQPFRNRFRHEEYAPINMTALRDKNTLLVTVLRDPIDRIISQYQFEGFAGGVHKWYPSNTKFLDKWNKKWRTFEEWVHDPHIGRPQITWYKPNYYMWKLTGSNQCNAERLETARTILHRFHAVITTPNITTHLPKLKFIEPTANPHKQWYLTDRARVDTISTFTDTWKKRIAAENKLLLQQLRDDNKCDVHLYETAQLIERSCLQ